MEFGREFLQFIQDADAAGVSVSNIILCVAVWYLAKINRTLTDKLAAHNEWLRKQAEKATIATTTAKPK